jgi:hypothetical protein
MLEVALPARATAVDALAAEIHLGPACVVVLRRGLTLAVALLMILVVPGCGTGTCNADGPGVDKTLASAERWLRVLSMPESQTGEETQDVTFQVVLVDSTQSEGSPRTEMIAVHSSFLPGIEEGLAARDDVFLALASKGLEQEMVAYMIVRDADGSHHFAGECAQSHEQFLRERLDGRYDATIDSVIGVTDRHRIKEILSV